MDISVGDIHIYMHGIFENPQMITWDKDFKKSIDVLYKIPLFLSILH